MKVVDWMAVVAPKARRVLLVGELNPYGSRPELALYHLPRGASGDNLRRHLGLSDVVYYKLAKANLCVGRWDPMHARLRAMGLVLGREHDVFVLLGTRVRDAFGGPAFFMSMRTNGCAMVSLPHPSGRCRLWNDPASAARAVEILRALAPDVPWGRGGEAVGSSAFGFEGGEKQL